jgi:hypothetical protein
MSQPTVLAPDSRTCAGSLDARVMRTHDGGEAAS